MIEKVCFRFVDLEDEFGIIVGQAMTFNSRSYWSIYVYCYN